jgi:hypothetical protein
MGNTLILEHHFNTVHADWGKCEILILNLFEMLISALKFVYDYSRRAFKRTAV